jgi:uncharacterized protein
MPAFAAMFRVHGNLNDFLPARQRDQAFSHAYDGFPAVKDTIESIGIPHPEIGCILMDGKASPMHTTLYTGQHVEVFPHEKHLAYVQEVRGNARPTFVADVHLGRLVAYLRMLGFDTIYSQALHDPQLAEISANEQRILLTRDLGLLKRSIVQLGAFVRATDPLAQLEEIIYRFDLFVFEMGAFRCPQCNGVVQMVDTAAVAHLLPGDTRQHYDSFTQCTDCAKVYWRGSHYQKVERMIAQIRAKRQMP